MKEMMEKLREASIKAILESEDVDSLEALRVKYLGKEGELTGILRQMGRLSAEERPVMGQLANQLRSSLEKLLEEKNEELSKALLEMKLQEESVDVTIPGKKVAIGHKHPMYNVLDQIKDIFIGMGFDILDDQEIEFSDYNFTKLNTPDGHPAREWSDTFYFTEDSKICLRTQTSPMQVHAMETKPLPIRMIAPGRVYRKDEVDATHSPMFHQITSRLRNPAPSWISAAINAAEKAARPARARAGSKSWAAGWFTRKCWLAAGSIRTSIPDGLSAWGWSVLLWVSTRFQICASFLKMMSASLNSSEKGGQRNEMFQKMAYGVCRPACI